MSKKKNKGHGVIKPVVIGIIFLVVASFQLYTLGESLFAYLDRQQFVHKGLTIPLEGTYYGYYMPDLFASSSLHVKILPAEHPTLTMLFLDWGSKSAFPSQNMYMLSKLGIVPVITWEPWDAKLHTSYQPSFAPRRIVAGAYDDYIRQFARDIAIYQKPIFLRFAHEMNGNWYPWGSVGKNTPAEYKAMWRHVHDIFQQEHAGNVLWIWSPNNTDSTGSIENIESYYPGTEFVDWVGFSAFNWGEQHGYHWKTFREIAGPVYAKMEFLNKPVMVAEMSSTNVGGIKEQWFDETLTSGLQFFPNIKAVIFYNANFGEYEFRLGGGMNEGTVISKHILTNPFFLTQLEFQAR